MNDSSIFLETLKVCTDPTKHHLEKQEKESDSETVPKLKLDECPKTGDTNEISERKLSDKETKLNQRIDEIFFNEKFVKEHLDELEVELDQLAKNDPENSLLIKGFSYHARIS